MSTSTEKPDIRNFCADDHPWCKGTSKEWITALLKRLRQKYRDQTYWIKCDYDGSESGETGALNDLPSQDDIIMRGWLHIYARPGNNEAHVIIMEWVRHRGRPSDPHQIIRLLTIKDCRNLEHALGIVAWLTQAVYR